MLLFGDSARLINNGEGDQVRSVSQSAGRSESVSQSVIVTWSLSRLIHCRGSVDTNTFYPPSVQLVMQRLCGTGWWQLLDHGQRWETKRGLNDDPKVANGWPNVTL